ncbi:MAG: hypothetical protein J6X60_06475 [Ruminiclostridium sp.]|nr:hypothetical protein [Ruminiclostridium sp.]
MNVFFIPIITAIVIILIVVAVIFIVIAIIKRKLNSLTRTYLHMDLKQTANYLGDGIRNETTIPKSISNVSAVYEPRLLRDFPDMTYNRFLDMANSALISILTAIEHENEQEIELATDSLKSSIKGIIQDNRGKNVVEHFDNIKLHRTGISNYNSSEDNATTDFEISFQCIHYYAGKDKKIPEDPSQFAARVTLSYGKEYKDDASSIVFSHNCPNCGAPVYSVGGKMMKCSYCGTGVTEEIYKSWLISAYRFI